MAYTSSFGNTPQGAQLAQSQQTMNNMGQIPSQATQQYTAAIQNMPQALDANRQANYQAGGFDQLSQAAGNLSGDAKTWALFQQDLQKSQAYKNAAALPQNQAFIPSTSEGLPEWMMQLSTPSSYAELAARNPYLADTSLSRVGSTAVSEASKNLQQILGLNTEQFNANVEKYGSAYKTMVQGWSDLVDKEEKARQREEDRYYRSQELRLQLRRLNTEELLAKAKLAEEMGAKEEAVESMKSVVAQIMDASLSTDPTALKTVLSKIGSKDAQQIFKELSKQGVSYGDLTRIQKSYLFDQYARIGEQWAALSPQDRALVKSPLGAVIASPEARNTYSLMTEFIQQAGRLSEGGKLTDKDFDKYVAIYSGRPFDFANEGDIKTLISSLSDENKKALGIDEYTYKQRRKLETARDNYLSSFFGEEPTQKNQETPDNSVVIGGYSGVVLEE